jgi:hypothetical protein
MFTNCRFRSLICGSAFDSTALTAGQARYIAHSRQDAAPTGNATELRKRSTSFFRLPPAVCNEWTAPHDNTSVKPDWSENLDSKIGGTSWLKTYNHVLIDS